MLDDRDDEPGQAESRFVPGFLFGAEWPFFQNDYLTGKAPYKSRANHRFLSGGAHVAPQPCAYDREKRGCFMATRRQRRT